MIATRSAPVTLINHELALDAYLQALLAAVPEGELEAPLAAVATVAVGGASAPTSLASVAAKACPGPPEVSKDEAAALTTVRLPTNEFQALFFRIGEITLATPVLDVRRIVAYDSATTALPNQPSWLLGLVENQGDTIGVMHTAELMLGRENIQHRDFDTRPYRHIIISRGGRYGFACDGVLEMVKLKPEEVRWRTTPTGHRAWLMGTVAKRLCVLVDLAELTPIRR